LKTIIALILYQEFEKIHTNCNLQAKEEKSYQ